MQNFTKHLSALAAPRTLAEFRAHQAALLLAKREEKARRQALASHLSTLKPTRFQAKAGKREAKHDALMAARHQAEAGPRSPFVPKPGKKHFEFVPYQQGAQAQLRQHERTKLQARIAYQSSVVRQRPHDIVARQELRQYQAQFKALPMR